MAHSLPKRADYIGTWNKSGKTDSYVSMKIICMRFSDIGGNTDFLLNSNEVLLKTQSST